MSPIAITLFILLAAVIAFMSGKIPMGIVAIGVALSLWAFGVLDLGTALSGFGDPTVVFIAALFVVSESLDSTGVTAWAGQQVIARGGTKRKVLLLVIGGLVALLTAAISVNGAVAALIPVVAVVAIRAKIAPSQMMMPLAFSAHAGSMLALTGTPVNIIISDAAADAGARQFNFFEFAFAGIPLVIGTVAIILFFGRHLLPTNEPTYVPTNLAERSKTLLDHYQLPAGTELVGTQTGAIEVVIAPRSPLVGTHLFAGQTTPSGDLVVMGVHRGGEPLEDRKSALQVGDTLLLSGSWDNLDAHTEGEEVVRVDDLAAIRRAVPLGRGAKRSIVVLVGMIVLLATGIVPAAVAALLAASAIVLMRVLSPVQAYRGISWTTVVLVAGMIPLSTAFTETGTADLIADGLLTFVGDSSPTLALLAMCVITIVLGQLISNTATVLIMVPIAAVISTSLDISPLPLLMGIGIAGAASFMTPVATPANTMIMEPGGYTFTDYWKLGLPLLLFFLAVAVFWVPVVWPF